MESSGRKSKSGLRGLTRLYAVQSLYRLQFDNENLEKIVKESEDNPLIPLDEDLSLSEIDSEFFKNLMKHLKENMPQIDKLIADRLGQNWSFERLDKVVQSILRLGVCEILFFDDIPDNVVFNEYIEIAKAFFKKSEVSFLNGVLNSISKSKREVNMQNQV